MIFSAGKAGSRETSKRNRDEDGRWGQCELCSVNQIQLLRLSLPIPFILFSRCWVEFYFMTLSLRRWCPLCPPSTVPRLILLLLSSPSLNLVLACRWRWLTARSVTSVVKGSTRWNASVLRASSSIGAASPATSAASHSGWGDTALTRLQVSTVCVRKIRELSYVFSN